MFRQLLAELDEAGDVRALVATEKHVPVGLRKTELNPIQWIPLIKTAIDSKMS